MGAKGRNFSNDLAVRYGYGDVATTIEERIAAYPRDGTTTARGPWQRQAPHGDNGSGSS